jgi:hypothetical protein
MCQVLLLKTNIYSGYTLLDLQYCVALENFNKDTQANYVTIIKKTTSLPSGVSISISLPMVTEMFIVIDYSKIPRFNYGEKARERVYYAIEQNNCISTILECKKFSINLNLLKLSSLLFLSLDSVDSA